MNKKTTDQTPSFFTFTPDITARDEKGIPTKFTGVAYTGGVVPNYGWYGDVIIDLASAKVPDGQIFALIDHDYTKRAGKLTCQLSGGSIIVNGEFFTNEAGHEVASLFAQGAPWQLSVGVMAKPKRYDEKTLVTINGGTHEVHAVLHNAIIREVSFVPVGADPNTAVAAFSAANSPAHDHQAGTSTGSNDMTIEELQAQVAKLTTELDTEKASRVAAESALATFRAKQREGELAQMSAKMGRALTDQEAAAFKAMDDTAFAIVFAAIPSVKAAGLPASLATEQATTGPGEAAKPGAVAINMSAIYDSRAQAMGRA